MEGDRLIRHGHFDFSEFEKERSLTCCAADMHCTWLRFAERSAQRGLPAATDAFDRCDHLSESAFICSATACHPEVCRFVKHVSTRFV